MMLNGIICVIIFCCGLFVGLNMEYKKRNKKEINPINEINVKETANLNPNELTSEIIDEWMNGVDE